MAYHKNTEQKFHFDFLKFVAFFFIFGVVNNVITPEEGKAYLLDWYENPYPDTIEYNWSKEALGISLPYDEKEQRHILPHEWIGDTMQTPLITFSWKEAGTTYGFFVPQIWFWSEIGFLMGIQFGMALFSAYLVYKFIIIPQNLSSNGKTTNTTGFLIGLGLIVPFWLLFPMFSLRSLNIDNKIIRFTLVAVTPSMCLFRTTEALSGGTPKFARQSLSFFLTYYATPNTPIYDEKNNKFVKASWNYLIWKFASVVFHFLVAALGYSFCDIFPNGTTKVGRGPPFEVYNTLWKDPSWHLMFNSTWQCGWWFGLFFYTMAGTGEGGQLATSLISGYEVESYFESPIWRTRTLTEGWGQRWNLMIQRILKRGIYVPIAKLLRNKTFSPVALIMTFIVSGLYHEWIVYMCILLPTSKSIENDTVAEDTFPYIYGGNWFFFAMQGFFVLIEVGLFPESWFKGYMPDWFKFLWCYIVCLPGPIFLAPYAHTTYFRDGYPGFPMVAPLPLPPCA